jgi:hypothetical protein
MSPTTIGRAVGALLLLAFVVYGAGSALADSADPARVPAGALLMLVNSAAVAAIGVLAFPVLRAHDEISAHAYLIGRAIEAALLTVGIVLLLLLVPLAREHADAGPDGASTLAALARVAKAGNDYSYQLAMISVGVAGLVFCRVLLRAGLVPRFLAVWGLAGYAVFLVGAVLEVLGHAVGVVLAVPGGLFEIVLGVLLVVRGFPVRREPGVLTAPVNG